MKIPKYIKNHIESNNQLLLQANKHSEIVINWYEKQLDKLNSENSDISEDEFYEIKTNWLSNGEIDLSCIEYNLKLLEDE